MSDPPTQLSLPPSLPYPITITRLLVKPGVTVQRGTHLLEYSFMSRAQREAIDKRTKEGRKAEISRGEVDGNDGSGTWDCLIEGEVVGWEDGVRVGIGIERRQASRPLLNVSQPCSHPVQLHGMCGICGADLTEDDYLSAPTPASSSNGAGPSRHPGGFEVTHDAMGVTVSKNEAQRLDNLTRDALLASRRLSLIVDLDQTIIHTTVDPTVAEWMDEIEAERAAVNQPTEPTTDLPESATEDTTTPPCSPKADSGNDSTTPPTSPHRASLSLPVLSPPKKEKNPNAEALQDVARFQIADDLLPGQVKPKRRPGQKDGMVQMQGRWYFTKPRPGLQKFLDEMSQLYEMHVYTMGTRTYADAICKVIDPDGRIFGGRILSRDESGSFSSKNLKRLFPTDTSMVVVIDDRSDVWADCPNLVKVVPYDFFIGIGDINSAFLPKNNKALPPPSSAATSSSAPPSPASPASAESTPPPATPADDPSVEDELLLKAKLLDEVSESRPLAKLQEALEESSEQTDLKEDQADEVSKSATAEENGDRGKETVKIPSPPDSPPRSRKPVLNPHDYELLRVSEILEEVHRRFYAAYDDLEDWDPKTSLPMSCDVEFIIPELKAKVLEGCDLIFSGLIPQAVDPTTTDIWQTAETFGALCSTTVHPRITHCVTATLNTEKTYFAGKAGAKIVWANWFWDSVALWRRQPEVKYLAGKKESQSATPAATPATLDEDAAEADQVDSEGALRDGPSADAEGSGRPGVEEEHENMDDDAAVGVGWDDDADKEWEEFMAGDDDDDDLNTENGSVKSVDSTPSTPSKKRVRYADEESLPLEDFKDPSPPQPDDPPTKRRKPLLLEAPQDDADIPQANKFVYRPPGSKGKAELDSPSQSESEAVHSRVEGEEEGEYGGDGASTVGTEGDDEFAMMLMDSLADNLDEAEGSVEAAEGE
ncbi:hypothetical protein IAU59_007449 [Kwoniella sp. CBS 9459]